MILVIVGPTGVGKTKASVELAKIFNGEIINADSMQVYKNMDIGTAKIREEEKEGIPHHLFDIVDVTKNYTIYNYQKDCRNKITEILNKGRMPILVGGSGLYIKSAIYDYKLEEEDNEDNYYTEFTNEELLYKIKLLKRDIDINVNNRRRLVRVYNKLLRNTYHDKLDTNLFYDNVIIIGLTTNRETLYDKINNRVDEMVKNGLIEEVESFYKNGFRSIALNTGIGYKELYSYFNKEINLDEAIDLIKKNSRHFAKRQFTWFNNQMSVNWFNTNYENFTKTIEEIAEFIHESNQNMVKK